MKRTIAFMVTGIVFALVLNTIPTAMGVASYIAAKPGDVYHYEVFNQMTNKTDSIGWTSVLQDRTIVSIGDDVGGACNVTVSYVYKDQLNSADYESKIGPVPAIPPSGTHVINASSNINDHVSTIEPQMRYIINSNAQNRSWEYFKNASGSATWIKERWSDNGILELFENRTFNNSTNITLILRVALLVDSIPGYDIPLILITSGVSFGAIFFAIRKKRSEFD